MGCNVSKDVKVEDQGNTDAAPKNNAGIMSEEKAAEKIQASFKGYKVRKSLKNNGLLPESLSKEHITKKIEQKVDQVSNTIKANVNEITDKVSNEVSEKVEKVKSKIEETSEELDIDLTDVDLEKAAVKIQASYRNFTKKKVVKAPENDSEVLIEQNNENHAKEEEKTEEKEAEPEKEETKSHTKEEQNHVGEENNIANGEIDDIDLEDPNVEKAAVKIQSTFRGYKARKEINTDDSIQDGE